MKKIIIFAVSLFTAGVVSAGSLTITAPSVTLGGSAPQWQYNYNGALTGVAPVTYVSSSTLVSSNTIVLASAPAAGLPLLLPHSAGNTGQIIQITKVNASTYPVTITTSGADLISGTTGLWVLNALGQTCELTADGSGNWWPYGHGCDATPSYVGPPIAPAGTFAVATSSDILACGFTTYVPITVIGFRTIYAGGGGASNVSFAIQDQAGNVLGSVTSALSTLGTTNTQKLATPLNLPPGSYHATIQVCTTNAAFDGASADASFCSVKAATSSGISSFTIPTGNVVYAHWPNILVIVAGGRQSE